MKQGDGGGERWGSKTTGSFGGIRHNNMLYTGLELKREIAADI